MLSLTVIAFSSLVLVREIYIYIYAYISCIVSLTCRYDIMHCIYLSIYLGFNLLTLILPSLLI